MQILISIVGAALAVVWLVAAVTCVQLLGHVRPEISKFSLLYRGHLFYRRDTFDEAAGPLHQRFIRCIALFFVGVVVLMLVSALTTARS